LIYLDAWITSTHKPRDDAATPTQYLHHQVLKRPALGDFIRHFRRVLLEKRGSSDEIGN
jgi:hypothetical protein